MSTPLTWSSLPLALAVAAVVFWLGFDGGTYSLESRSTVAIVAWWALVMAIGLGLWPLRRVSHAALAVTGLLAAYATWTALSMIWAPSVESAFSEFNRIALFLAVFGIAVCAATRANVAAWADGIGIGIAAVGFLALLSRLFPAVLPAGDVPEFLPETIARLSYPVEYWNGLAILIGLALPLLLRMATAPGAPALRGLALGLVPPLAAAVYLTSSRGGVATALVATLVYLVATNDRWPVVAAIAFAAAGSAGAVAAVASRRELVNEPFSAAAEAQGGSGALFVLLAAVSVGMTWGLARRFAPRFRPPGRVGRVVAVSALAAAIVGLVLSDPNARFEEFTELPQGLEQSSDPVRAHLLSGSGSGRWQFWQAAADQWETEPLIGRGAGTYEAWWAQNGTVSLFVRDAHSLYLEALAELGIVGLLLICGALATGLAAGVRRVRASRGAERATAAALLGALAAYVFAAGIDWVWELTAVAVVGVVCLGLLTGPATDVGARPRAELEPGRPRRLLRFAAGAGVLAVGWLLICAQAIPLLSELKLSDSQAASRRGDLRGAAGDAVAARALEPWSADPYLQLALLEEELGSLDAAAGFVEDALDRDPENWRLWLTAARIETKRGEIAAARERIDRARALNPRSPLFAQEQ